MQLSNKKLYNISEVLKELKPETIASVWFDSNGIGTIKVEHGDLPTEEELDALGNMKALEQAKKDKCSEINAARDNKNIQPILHNTNGEDKYLTIDILDWNTHALAMSDTETIDWICTDNTTIQLNCADILSLCNHIRNRRTNSYIAGRLRKDTVLALSTIEEVEAYNVVI